MIQTNNTDTTSGLNGPDIEIADILREHLSDYQQAYHLPFEHKKVVEDILNCRTDVLGGKIEMCNACGYLQYIYNSCRNRHCPKCQTLTKEKWIDARKAELLPVKYFHVVFTLAHEINPVALCNKKLIYTILFKAASNTIKQLGIDPAHKLEGKIGITAILHTWDQKLNDHLHLHCVVPGGALSFDKTRWNQSSSKYLFPVKVMSLVFRGKFIDYLKDAYNLGEIEFPGKTKAWGTKSGFRKLIEKLWSKKWVVYAKKPFGGPQQILEYIGRYTHRVAISNNRILSLKDGRVTFLYRNRKKETTEIMHLDAVEFIRRFLLHILPSGFMRIRHYGIIANRCKKENIGICRELLGISTELPETVEKSLREMMLELTGEDISLCPVCKKGKMEFVAEIPVSFGVYRRSFSKHVTIEDST